VKCRWRMSRRFPDVRRQVRVPEQVDRVLWLWGQVCGRSHGRQAGRTPTAGRATIMPPARGRRCWAILRLIALQSSQAHPSIYMDCAGWQSPAAGAGRVHALLHKASTAGPSKALVVAQHKKDK
jgi:hypothetical protein